MKIQLLGFLCIIMLVSCNKNVETIDTKDMPPGNTYKAGNFHIGQHYGGGIIFYIDATGQHGFIAAKEDAEEPAFWAYKDSLLGVRSPRIGTGKRNTWKTYQILGDMGEGSDYAALRALENKFKGFHDWYLPSKDELNLLFQQKEIIGGFSAFAYWSSTEYNAGLAWFLNFENGEQIKSAKLNSYAVRPIRDF